MKINQSRVASEAGLVVEALTNEQIGPTFAILRLTQRHANQRRWEEYCRRTLAAKPERRGIITVRRKTATFPSGLACYHCGPDFEAKRLLTAHPFTAVDILDPGPFLASLAAGLVCIARVAACQAVRLVVPEGVLADRTLLGLPNASEIKTEYTFTL